MLIGLSLISLLVGFTGGIMFMEWVAVSWGKRMITG